MVHPLMCLLGWCRTISFVSRRFQEKFGIAHECWAISTLSVVLKDRTRKYQNSFICGHDMLISVSPMFWCNLIQALSLWGVIFISWKLGCWLSVYCTQVIHISIRISIGCTFFLNRLHGPWIMRKADSGYPCIGGVMNLCWILAA